MPREQKLGITLLIMAIGFAGAFCFRRPSTEQAALPGLLGERRINQRVAELRTRPLLPGIDLRESASPALHPDEILTRELAGLLPSELTYRNKQAAPPPIGTILEKEKSVPRVPAPADAPPGEHTPVAPEHYVPATQSIPRPVQSEMHYHVVQPGETLTAIALQYYGSVSRYLDLYEANKDQLSSPNQLRPNMKLRIPGHSSTFPAPRTQEVKEARGSEEDASVSRLDHPVSSEHSTAGSPSTNVDSADTGKKLFVPARRSPFQNTTDQERLARDLLPIRR